MDELGGQLAALYGRWLDATMADELDDVADELQNIIWSLESQLRDITSEANRARVNEAMAEKLAEENDGGMDEADE